MLTCAGSQFLDGDGRFPNHIPNPENKAAMQAGSRMVTDSGADLGVVFDTDVDRSAVVARDGGAINSNRYIALMSYIALRCVTMWLCQQRTQLSEPAGPLLLSTCYCTGLLTAVHARVVSMLGEVAY